MATIFRQPGYNRREVPPRIESALAATDQGRLDNLLKSKDSFFSGPGCAPEYDYPNPRGAQYPQDLRTYANPTPLNLGGRDKFFAAPGEAPRYDYPNPRGAPFAQELRTWAVSVAVALFASALPRVQQHTPPNPLDKPFPSDQRGYAQSSPIQLAGQDRVFGASGEVPSYDFPNPSGARPPSDLRTFVNATSLNLLLGRDQFFSASGQGPAYDYPNPTIRKSGASAFAFTPSSTLPLATVVIAPATTTFDYPNPRGRAFPSDLRSLGQSASPGLLTAAPPVVSVFDYPNPRGPVFPCDLRTANRSTVLPLITVVVAPPATTVFDYPNPKGPAFAQLLRTHVSPSAVNLFGRDRFFGTAGQGPVYDYPNPQVRQSPQQWSPSTNTLVLANVVFPSTRVFDYPNPRGVVFPSTLRTHLGPVAVQLIGRDRFFGAVGQGPVYNYPNPSVPKRAQGFTNHQSLTLLSSGGGLLLLRRRRAVL